MCFEYGGVRFIEYRGTDFGGTAFMTSNEARLVASGTMDAFGVYASPANNHGGSEHNRPRVVFVYSP